MIDVLNDIATRLATTPYIERVVLFGSRARGDHDERSDIDLAIECPSASRESWQQICDQVDETRTLLFIDLIRLENTSDALRDRINREGIVLYER